MTLKTPQEYIDDLRKMDIRLYLFGELVNDYVDHPLIRPSINAMAMTYKLAQDRVRGFDDCDLKSYRKEDKPIYTSSPEY